MARNSTADVVIADNAHWLASTGGLRVVDALAIHDAIHSSATSVTVSGQTLRVFVSDNGCRRCDVIVDPWERPKGRCKLMEQNKKKPSDAARRAREGEKITWIIPLDAAGKHTAPTTGWGRIENGVLKQRCNAVLAADVQASKKGAKKAPPPPPAPAPKKQKVDADEARAVGRKMRLAADPDYIDPDELRGIGFDDIVHGMTGKERELWLKAISAFNAIHDNDAAKDTLNGLLKLGGARELAMASQPVPSRRRSRSTRRRGACVWRDLWCVCGALQNSLMSPQAPPPRAPARSR